MVRFFLEELEVFFPYSHVYPEQFAYMRQLKATLDAKGHGVLEMPTGTGKTVALMALVSSYQLLHPEVEKFFFCTRTTAEMEKALLELKGVLRYRLEELLAAGDSRAERASILACALSARRNLCIHPTISREHDRNKIDEDCRQLTAPWVRRRHAGENLDLETMFESIDDCRLCPWYEALETKWSVETMPREVYTIEDLKTFGATGKNPIRDDETGSLERLKAQHAGRHRELYSTTDLGDDYGVPPSPQSETRFCSYFASRRMAQAASILVLNYQYVLDPRVSQVAFGNSGLAMGKGQLLAAEADDKAACEPWVIVFDEAHNIDNVCIEALSINLTVLDIEKARASVRKLQRLIGQQKQRGQEHLRSEFERLIRGTLSQSVADTSAQASDATTASGADYESMLAEHMASPLLPAEQSALARSLVPGNIRKSELFLMNLHVVVVYLDEYIRQFKVQSEGPLTFLKKLEEKTTITAISLQHFYERLKTLFVTLEVTDLQEYTSLVLVADFCTLVSTYWKGFIVIADPYPDGAVITAPNSTTTATGIYDPLLQLYCIDASLAMSAVIKRFQSVVLTSGTISPLYLYPKILGFTPFALESFPMSLERQCICPLIVSKAADQTLLSSRYDMRDDESVILNYGRLLEEFCEIVPDGIVCFFTSYTFMKSVVGLWYRRGVIAKVLERKLILMEIQNDTINTTLALNTYRKCCDIGRGAVFFSVARGKVSEGIDFNLHYGRCVIMFGIPYQYTLSKTLRARLLYLKENFNIPESEFLSFDALRSTSQCIGRIIRSKIDYGIIVLADYRYSKPDKKTKLPKWVQDSFSAGTAGVSVDNALAISKHFLYEMSQPFQLGLKTRLDAAALAKLAQLIKKKQLDSKAEPRVKDETDAALVEASAAATTADAAPAGDGMAETVPAPGVVVGRGGSSGGVGGGSTLSSADVPGSTT